MTHYYERWKRERNPREDYRLRSIYDPQSKRRVNGKIEADGDSVSFSCSSYYGQMPAAQRRELLMAKIRAKQNKLYVNRRGQPHTKYGHFGRDVRFLTKKGLIEMRSERQGHSYAGRPITCSYLALTKL